MNVVLNDEVYPCTKTVKTADSIMLYNGDKMFMSFNGISDFSAFGIEGGEWTEPPKTDSERISDAETTLQTHDSEITQIITGLEALANG